MGLLDFILGKKKKKVTTKKVAVKKKAVKKITPKKASIKKVVVKKVKVADKKKGVKKNTAKKNLTKKVSVKKETAKKVAVKKVAVKIAENKVVPLIKQTMETPLNTELVGQIDMGKSKIDSLNYLLQSLSIKKAKELIAKSTAGIFDKVEAEKAMIFKDLALDEAEIKELLQHNYISIESRLGVLNKGHFFDESIMIGMLFLTDTNDKKRLFDGNLKINDESFLTILFLTCISLHHTRNFSLCKPYIELLQKLVIVYQNQSNYLPKDIIQRIAFDCYRA